MILKKCDRCGKIIEEKEKKTNLFKGFADALESLAKSTKKTGINESQAYNLANILTTEIDLCPECFESFICWYMEGQE